MPPVLTPASIADLGGGGVIAPGAVTATELASGSLTAADAAADLATQAELNTAVAFADTEGSQYAGIDNRQRFIAEFGAASIYDQEFDGVDIADDTFPTDWSAVAFEAGTVYRQAFSCGRIDWGGGGDASNIQAVVRTLPATTTFTAYAHLAGLMEATAAETAGRYTTGMVLYRSTNGDFIQFGRFGPDITPTALTNPIASQYFISHYADADTSTTTLATGPYVIPDGQGHGYYRITKESDTSYDFHVSPDGLCWFSVGSNVDVGTTLGGDPTHIGFSVNGPGAAHVGCEWLRIRGLT